MNVKGSKFSDRQAESAKAKMELLARARANSPANDPEFAARLAARAEASRERDERREEMRVAKKAAAEQAEANRIAEEARLAEEARVKAEQDEAERLKREVAQQIAEAKARLAQSGGFAVKSARR